MSFPARPCSGLTVQPPPVLAHNGCLAGAFRHRGVRHSTARIDRAVCRAARADRARQAALLRHGGARQWLRDGGAG